MPDSEIRTEAQARAEIEKTAREFLKAFNYENELGVFSRAWSIYKDLPLSRFKEHREDRMFLPGMEITLDISNIAIQTFGGVWEELLKGAALYGGKTLFNLVRDRALATGAPQKLAGQLAGFFTSRLKSKDDA